MINLRFPGVMARGKGRTQREGRQRLAQRLGRSVLTAHSRVLASPRTGHRTPTFSVWALARTHAHAQPLGARGELEVSVEIRELLDFCAEYRGLDVCALTARALITGPADVE